MFDYTVAFVNTDGVAFPATGAKNASGPSATDGTEFVKILIDDAWGFNQALMAEAGLTPDGVQEAYGASQRLEAVKIVGIKSGTYRRNYVINGGMNVAQEGSSFTLAAGVPKWTLDMHKMTSTGGNAVVSQVANTISLSANKSAMRVTGAAGVTEIVKQTRIESNDSANMAGKCVYSILIENNSGAAIVPVLDIRTADAEDDFSATTSRDGKTFASLANGAEIRLEYAADITGIADVKNGVELKLTYGTGAFASGTIDVVEEQFEIGEHRTVFLHEPVSETIGKCKRYWESSYDYGVSPGSVTTIGMRVNAVTGIASVARIVETPVTFQVMKRTTPSVTLYSPITGATGNFHDSSIATDIPKAAVGVGQSGCYISYSTAVQAGYSVWNHFTVDARLN